ncbi:MAG: hypothetical protein JO101_10100, partial [Candidatus Eremiobacteraeota bacterium]|nr:hypothetical protein [Candidatus Eremiobacteraeota bacterium]
KRYLCASTCGKILCGRFVVQNDCEPEAIQLAAQVDVGQSQWRRDFRLSVQVVDKLRIGYSKGSFFESRVGDALGNSGQRSISDLAPQKRGDPSDREVDPGYPLRASRP